MKSRIAAALMAVVFSVFAVEAAVAQNRAEEPQKSVTQGTGDARMGRNRNRAQQTPEQILEAAREQAALASTGCVVTEAKLLGQTAERTSIYEIACSTGPGYIIESKTPPVATDCVILATSAEKIRAADPSAEVGPQCTFERNTDTIGFIRGYAQQAGVPCSVDQGTVIGKANDGGIVYEVGCSGEQGYWLKHLNNAWTTTPCIQVLAEQGACSFTTPEEIAASITPVLAGTEASACDVTAARLMGRNANGMFYEAKCAAGDGFIARVAEGKTEQIYPCATAQQIGGGCTLTSAPPAAPTTTEQNP